MGNARSRGVPKDLRLNHVRDLKTFRMRTVNLFKGLGKHEQMRIKDIPKENRPRERFEKHPATGRPSYQVAITEQGRASLKKIKGKA